MYKVDRSKNRISPLNRRLFSELELRERDHLQEWLAAEPSALGEELLIIQKEFDGFEDTRERLDLLALDKEGRLVVIENKLDDSGRDVVWQAAKYASYCSTLTKSQIVSIYQRFIDAEVIEGNAESIIADFLEQPSLDEAVLNPGSDQRIILIAAAFRKEVTATALWLLSHGLSIQCFTVTPFSYGEELLIDIRQVIPTPEAEEYMIGMASKDEEEKKVKRGQTEREARHLEYWELVLEEINRGASSLFRNVSAGKGHWLSAGSGLRSCPFNVVLGKGEIRVEFWLGRQDRDENKLFFDALMERREQIETAFEGELTWRRLDHRKSSRVEYAAPFETTDREIWPELVNWHARHIERLEKAFSPEIERLNGLAD